MTENEAVSWRSAWKGTKAHRGASGMLQGDVEWQWELRGFCVELCCGWDFVLGWTRVEKAKVEKPLQYLSSRVSHKRTSVGVCCGSKAKSSPAWNT